MNECAEITCTTCSHCVVCKHREDLLTAQKTIDDTTILFKDSFIKLRDMKWIRPVTLQCEHYTYYKGGTIR